MRLPANFCRVVSVAVALSTALVAATALRAETAKPSNPIKIGFIASLTGVAAGPSKELVNGMELFLQENKYIIAGRPVQLMVESDESSAATGRAKFIKLAEQDKVDLVAGLQLANIALAVTPMAEKYQVPLVVSVAGADDVTQRKRNAWTIRTSASASQPVHPFGEWVYSKLGYRKIACIGVDYAFGWEVIGGFQKSFEQAGGQVIQKLWVPPGFTDFHTTLSTVRKDCDAVFLGANSQAAELITKQFKEMGFKMPIIGAGSNFDEAVLNKIGEPALGVLSPMCYSAVLDTPANKKFSKAYRAAYKDSDPSYYSECGYVSGMWIKKAIESLKGDVSDKEKLMSALKAVTIDNAPRGGKLRLDAYSNPIENIYVRKVENMKGHLQNKVIHTFKDVSQFTPWTAEEYLKNPVYSKTYPPCTHCAK